MIRTLAAAALACALAACAGPGTSNSGWREIAIGAGRIIGETRADAEIARLSEDLSRYCGALRAVTIGAVLFAPDKQRRAAEMAAAAVATVCDAPPRDLASALVTAADAYDAAVAAGLAR